MNTWSTKWFESWNDLTSNQPWQTALEDWWRQVADQSATQPPQAFEKIASQSRAFFQLAEQFGELLRSSDPGTDWQANLEPMFDSLKAQFAGPGGAIGDSFWQAPLANWQKTMASLTPQQLDPSMGLNQMLSFPGLGYGREFQKENQNLARLTIAYQKASERYFEIFAEMNQQSLDLMRTRLTARMDGADEPITSIRDLYNLWVDCSEEVYGSEALSEDYTARYGEMINSLMALKRQHARMTDDFAKKMNMPTRAEIDTLHERYQASRRSGRKLEGEISVLRKQIAELSQAVTQIQPGSPGVDPKASPKKRVAKKRTGKKTHKAPSPSRTRKVRTVKSS